MGLTKFQQTKCQEIIEKLINWPICSPFIELVDPERDGAPDYLEIIKHINGISMVFQKDAKTYNGEDTLFTHMAMEASIWVENKMKRFPSTPEEEWTGKIQRTAKKLFDVLSHPPAELDPSGKFNSGEINDENTDKA